MKQLVVATVVDNHTDTAAAAVVAHRMAAASWGVVAVAAAVRSKHWAWAAIEAEAVVVRTVAYCTRAVVAPD